MSNYAILSDLHGNLQALEAVSLDMSRFDLSGMLLLGDLIDYGMQSNETVHHLKENICLPVLCNLWGNHERAIMKGDFTGFSSRRGEESARFTASKLNDETRRYLEENLVHEGLLVFQLAGRNCLAVHGSLEDPYWKSIAPENVRGDYRAYDLVFSGHSHCSHVFSKFYPASAPEYRNQHAVLFINPGSVGQPRNHHPEAQYAILDTDSLSVNLRSVPYDVKKAQSYFGKSTDVFYRDRLSRGI